jgi:competence protein ComEC
MSVIAGVGGRAVGLRGTPGGWAIIARLARLRDAYALAIRLEIDERRLFLWVPVCAGAGAIVHLTAERDPSLPFSLGLMAACGLLAVMPSSPGPQAEESAAGPGADDASP